MENIKKAAGIIKKGGVVVAPTDTVYGLLADATNKKAVEKVFKIKKRSKSNPLPIFVKNIGMAKNLTELSSEQEKFLKKVWPGKITAVLKRKAKSPAFTPPSLKLRRASKASAGKEKRKIYGVDKKTIALRIPKYELLLSLAEQLNRPLIGTSANISGQPASGNIKEVLRQFEGRKYQPDLIIDEGNLPKSRPSKVIDLTVSPPRILRE